MMKYTAVAKDGTRVEDLISIEWGMMFMGEGGHVEDESGNVVISWDSWVAECKAQGAQ